MKILEATPKFLNRWPTRHRARKAACCGYKIKPGQHVVTHDLDVPTFGTATVTFHVACLRARLEDVPEDTITPTSARAAWQAERRAAIAERTAA